MAFCHFSSMGSSNALELFVLSRLFSQLPVIEMRHELKNLLILMQIFDFSRRRFFSKMFIGFTLSSLDLQVLQISSGALLKGRNPGIVVVY